MCKGLPPNYGLKGYLSILIGLVGSTRSDLCQQARTPRICMWRKKGEGLHQECNTKGKKEGTGRRMAKFMVAIYHDSGVIECFQYEGNINGELFSQFVRDRFPHIFSNGNNQKGELFLQDGDPSQNCKMSQEAMDKIPCRLFMIPLGPLT